MPDAIAVGVIGGVATVIVGFLGYFGLRITKGLEGVSSRIDRIEAKIDRLGETQADTRERIARLEERESRLLAPASSRSHGSRPEDQRS